MPDFWWLDHAIASMQPKFRTLILIDKINPASDAENELKSDCVIMHHVGYRTTIRNADMAGNNRAAKPVGNQITIVHASAANHPWGRIGKPPHDIAVLCWRGNQQRIPLFNENPHTVGCGQFACSTGDAAGVGHQQAQIGNTAVPGNGCIKPNSHTMPRQDGNRRIICRENLVEPEAKCIREKRHIGCDT